MDVPSWMEALRDRAGPLLEKALDLAAWKGPSPFPGGAAGTRRLAELVDAFAHDEEASDADDARFVEGAGAMLGLLLLAHVGLGEYRKNGVMHRVALGRRGWFDPFAAIDASLDAPQPTRELARRVATAEAEAAGDGPIARIATVFEDVLAEARPGLSIARQFELELLLSNEVEVDLTRIAEATDGQGVEAVRTAARKLASLLPGEGEVQRTSWDEARPILLPRLVASAFVEELHRAHPASHGRIFGRSLCPGIEIALVLAYEGRARYVRTDEVGAWLDHESAVLAQAVENLASRSARARFAAVDTDHGRLVVARSGDGLDAARLLLPGLSSVLGNALPGPHAVAVPHRDTLLACSADDARAVAFLRQRAEDDAARAPHRIASVVLRVDGRAVEVLGG